MNPSPAPFSQLHGLPKTQAALNYARELHAGQSRDADGAPFILHPSEVASLLYDVGAPDHLIAAGALHDVIEKTAAVGSDLRERFGWQIAALVLAVTEDGHVADHAARKAALRDRVAHAGEEALLLFAADKVSKARELGLDRAEAAVALQHGAPEGRSRKLRLAHYRQCLTLLRERLPDSPLVSQLDAELERHQSRFSMISFARDH